MKSCEPENSNNMKSSQSDTSPPSLSTMQILRLVSRSVSVEPCMFLMRAGLEVMFGALNGGMLWKISEQRRLAENDKVIFDSQSESFSEEEQSIEIQQAAAVWSTIGSLSQIAPLIIIAPIYGIMGDRYGRKINLMLGLMGMILTGLVQTAQFSVVQMPLLATPVFNVLIAFTGSIGSMYASCFAYIADETSDHDLLTFRMSFLQVCGTAAEILFGFVEAGLLTVLSYAFVSLTSMFLFSAGFFYTIMALQQISPTGINHDNVTQQKEKLGQVEKERHRTEDNDISKTGSEKSINKQLEKPGVSKSKSVDCVCKRIWNDLFVVSAKAVTKRRDGHLRAYIWITVVCFFALNCSRMGTVQVVGLFCMGKPLQWKPSGVSFYIAVNAVIDLFGTLCGTFLMKKLLRFHETSILLVTMVSACLRCILTGLARNTAMMYVAAISGIFSNLTFAVTKSLMVQFVERDEIGKVYALLQVATDLSVTVGLAGFSGLYSLTLSVYPGLVFFATGFLALSALLPFIWVHISFKTRRMMKTRKTGFRNITAESSKTCLAASSEASIHTMKTTLA